MTSCCSFPCCLEEAAFLALLSRPRIRDARGLNRGSSTRRACFELFHDQIFAHEGSNACYVTIGWIPSQFGPVSIKWFKWTA
jgi:hypothetical protein